MGVKKTHSEIYVRLLKTLWVLKQGQNHSKSILKILEIALKLINLI